MFSSNADNLGTTSASTQVYLRDRNIAKTVTISHSNSDASAGANAASVHPTISDDGSTIAYVTAATDIVGPGPGPGAKLVARGSSGASTLVADGVDFGSVPSLSGDGKDVAFVTSQALAGAGDTNGLLDVYATKTAGGAFQAISVRPDGQAGNGASTEPAISADGQKVAYQSEASDIGADADNSRDIFLRDRSVTNSPPVSRADDPGVAAGVGPMAYALHPSISPDGSRVTFLTNSPRFGPPDGRVTMQLRDVVAAHTYSVGNPVDGDAASFPAGDVTFGEIVAGGREVAFGFETPTGSSSLFVRDVYGPPPMNVTAPAISGSAVVGAAPGLVCAPGSWSGDPDNAFTCRWTVDGVASGTTTAVFSVAAGDVGHQVRCLVTAAGFGGQSTASSDAVVPPQAGPQGTEGAAGTQGAAGAQGIAGPTGSAGSTGPAGPTGPAGRIVCTPRKTTIKKKKVTITCKLTLVKSSAFRARLTRGQRTALRAHAQLGPGRHAPRGARDGAAELIGGRGAPGADAADRHESEARRLLGVEDRDQPIAGVGDGR